MSNAFKIREILLQKRFLNGHEQVMIIYISKHLLCISRDAQMHMKKYTVIKKRKRKNHLQRLTVYEKLKSARDHV